MDNTERLNDNTVESLPKRPCLPPLAHVMSKVEPWKEGCCSRKAVAAV